MLFLFHVFLLWLARNFVKAGVYPKKMLTIEQIQYTSKPSFYTITVIPGLSLAFYLSSGQSSLHPLTWFPCFGVINVKNIQKASFDADMLKVIERMKVKLKDFAPIWIIKPHHYKISQEMEKLVGKVLINKSIASSFLRRMGSDSALLISSWLGGGFWSTADGKSLYLLLRKKYAYFYLPLPTIDFLQSEQPFTKIEQVNQWIFQKANVKNSRELIANFLWHPKEIPHYEVGPPITPMFEEKSAILPSPPKPLAQPSKGKGCIIL